MTHANIQQLLADKVHLAPQAWRTLKTAERARFDHPWAVALALGRELERLPPSAVRLLAAEHCGHLVLVPRRGRYAPGPQTVGERELPGVAFVGVPDLLAGGPELWFPIGQLLDHLLGGHGEPGAPWLADGGGITPAWAEVGQRLRERFPLGHGVDELARSHPRAYLAQSLAWHLAGRRQALQVADPLMARLLRTTLLSEAFWRRSAAGG